MIKLRKKTKKERERIKERVKDAKERHSRPGRYSWTYLNPEENKRDKALMKQLKHGEKLEIKGIKKGWDTDRYIEATGGVTYKDGKMKTVHPKNLKMKRLEKKVARLTKKKGLPPKKVY